MRTTRLMTLFGLTMYCLTCTAIAQVTNAGQQPKAAQPASKLPDAPTEDPFGKSEDPFSGSPQGENPFGAGDGGAGETQAAMRFVMEGQTLKPSRVYHFNVNVDSLTIGVVMIGGLGGYPGGGMGGDGMSGGDVGRMMGMGGMGSGDMGGMSGPGMSGMGSGDMGGMMGGGMGGMAGPNPNLVRVSAYVFDDEKRDGRTRIELAVSSGKKGALIPLVKLQSPQGKAKPKLVFTPTNAKLVEDAIRLKIWKMDAIRNLKSIGGKGDQATEAEQLLKAILTEEYEGQIKRQEFELARLKSQLAKIQDEITRRQGAKDRVIDVQLGKILLEAQGIIGQADQ